MTGSVCKVTRLQDGHIEFIYTGAGAVSVGSISHFPFSSFFSGSFGGFTGGGGSCGGNVPVFLFSSQGPKHSQGGFGLLHMSHPGPLEPFGDPQSSVAKAGEMEMNHKRFTICTAKTR